jgi:hypothetical protein
MSTSLRHTFLELRCSYLNKTHWRNTSKLTNGRSSWNTSDEKGYKLKTNQQSWNMKRCAAWNQTNAKIWQWQSVNRKHEVEFFKIWTKSASNTRLISRLPLIYLLTCFFSTKVVQSQQLTLFICSFACRGLPHRYNPEQICTTCNSTALFSN